jgi:hypothetical protein
VWQLAPDYVDQEQYTRQTAGWNKSLESLQAFDAAYGPFDGVMGFSQGAAIAAALCVLQQLGLQELTDHDSDMGCVRSGQQGLVKSRFKFAILASGFLSPCPEHAEALQHVGLLQMPSFHIFGGGLATAAAAGDPQRSNPETNVAPAQACSCQATDCRVETGTNTSGLKRESQILPDHSGDRQINADESEQLVSLFDPSSGRRVVRHGQGHIIPCKRSVTEKFCQFLDQQRMKLVS